VTGGETATRVLRAWHTTALELVEEIEPGVPLSVSVGARPIAVVTKAGSFGQPQTLTRSLTKLRSWIKAQARARELGRRA
jgi:4-hydroxythreonine-4-phosphate dehydrogenase